MKSIIVYFLLLNTLVYPQQPFAVVELFTSEGCSSCPPADEVLSKLKNDAEKSGQRIYPIAYHVDYWNKYGWKDPYSKYQFTIRQENYSRVLPEKEMYTPQAVINGRFSCVGSKKDEINKNISQALEKNPGYVFSMKKDSLKNDTMYLSYSFPKGNHDFVLRLILTEDGLVSKVGKGENSGKTLSHDGVARSLFSVDNLTAKGNAKIDTNVFTGKGKKHLIAFIQQKKSMEIVAVEELPIF